MAVIEALTFREIREQAAKGTELIKPFVHEIYPETLPINEAFEMLEVTVCPDERAARTAIWDTIGHGAIKIVAGNQLAVNK
jgi:hypothetical protein